MGQPNVKSITPHAKSWESHAGVVVQLADEVSIDRTVDCSRLQKLKDPTKQTSLKQANEKCLAESAHRLCLRVFDGNDAEVWRLSPVRFASDSRE